MDTNDLTEAVDQNRDMLYRLAYSILRNDADCADALQEALLRAWRRLDTLREDAKFRSWMAKIVVNTSRDMLRKRRRTTEALLEDLPMPSTEKTDLHEALDRLDD